MKLRILSILMIIVMGGQTIINAYPVESWREASAQELLAKSFEISNFSDDRTYNQPLYNGDRLDWCLNWGSDCGKAAAVAFCNSRRYEDVVVFRAEVVGRSARTRLIGSNQTCDGQDFCTAFAYITCTKPIRYKKVFANPRWKEYRLDVCERWGANCGKPAADAFCKSKGFSRSLEFRTDSTAGRGATRLIGTDEICDKPFCVGFQQIICE